MFKHDKHVLKNISNCYLLAQKVWKIYFFSFFPFLFPINVFSLLDHLSNYYRLNYLQDLLSRFDN